MPTVTSTGLGSGVDINGLVTKLVNAEQTPTLTRLAKKETQVQAKISAYGTFKGNISAFRDSLAALKNARGFQKPTATSSDETTLTATTDTNADLGSYKIEVKQTAQNHVLASGRYAAADSTVGTGKLTIQLGTTDYTPASSGSPENYAGFTANPDRSAVSITIDSANNTLTGVRDAINSAKAGVSASVINDGGGFRLVLTSTDSGARNSIQTTVEDGDGNHADTAGLSALAFNATATHLDQTQGAQDAKLTINGLEVSSASNTVTQAFKGVTLNIKQASPGRIVNVGVSQNDGDISKSLENFVKTYNAIVKSAADLGSYDKSTRKAGVLLGEAAFQGVVGRLRSELTQGVTGSNGNFQTLSTIGLTFQKDGTLQFDSSKLTSALSTDRAGITALFATMARSSDSNVGYIANTNETKTGSYPLNISQAATQGHVAGDAATSFVVNADNDTLKIKIDGVQSGAIGLTQADYSADPSRLATELQTKINADSAIKASGVAVTVKYDTTASKFVIQSKSFGASSQVELTEVDTHSTATLGLKLGSSSADNTGGKDVAGTIGAAAATGKGQLLTATEGDAKGLKLLIADSKSGDRGTIQFARGLMERLDTAIGGLLDTNGTVKSRTDGLQGELDKIANDRTALSKRMDKLQTRLLTQFNAMDAIVGRFQSTSSYLTQQLAALPGANK